MCLELCFRIYKLRAIKAASWDCRKDEERERDCASSAQDLSRRESLPASLFLLLIIMKPQRQLGEYRAWVGAKFTPIMRSLTAYYSKQESKPETLNLVFKGKNTTPRPPNTEGRDLTSKREEGVGYLRWVRKTGMK